MGTDRKTVRRLNSESGVTLYIVAGAMVLLLAVSALAIDLVSLYVARSEAQRAADAGALAGAYVFYTQGCTTGVGGCVAGGAQETPATTAAVNVASQNMVGGQAPSASSVTTAFSYPNAEEPEISVTVHRDAASGNAMPTFFAKILGVSTVDVSATATAEAFNPSGGSTATAVGCIKPFLVPNCDSTHPVLQSNAEANTNCGGTGKGDGATILCPPGIAGTCYPSYFFDPNNKYSIVNPGTYNSASPNTGGVIGAEWQLHSDAAPSQWYLIGFTGNSGAQLRQYIETCAPTVIACSSPAEHRQRQEGGTHRPGNRRPHRCGQRWVEPGPGQYFEPDIHNFMRWRHWAHHHAPLPDLRRQQQPQSRPGQQGLLRAQPLRVERSGVRWRSAESWRLHGDRDRVHEPVYPGRQPLRERRPD